MCLITVDSESSSRSTLNGIYLSPRLHIVDFTWAFALPDALTLSNSDVRTLSLQNFDILKEEKCEHGKYVLPFDRWVFTRFAGNKLNHKILMIINANNETVNLSTKNIYEQGTSVIINFGVTLICSLLEVSRLKEI